MSRPFADGELIVLVDKVGRRHRVRLRAGERHSIHSGLIAHDDLIGRPEGVVVTTQMGARLLAVRPTFAEQVTGRRRQTQPIYPKDLGAILMGADIHPGARVLEAGTGTGALTMAALRAVGPQGHVVSYEAREEFLEAARRAIVETLGSVPANLTLKLGDVYLGVEETDFDRVLLDLPEPWQAVPTARAALRAGGILFAHCPNVSQVQRLFDCLREERGFGMLEAFELLQRGWTVRGRSMRPSHRMVAHTGFLCFARRLAEEVLFEPEGEGFR
jgi:tRNA (adenine57-N1/adenine58-N1)-methyltransferase